MNLINKKLILIHIYLIIFLGFLVYANSLNGEFIWDDNIYIKDNPNIKDLSKIADIFSEKKSLGFHSDIDINTYRPLQIFTYALDYSLWGLNVIGYHLTSILLHILVALCIYWFVSILYNDRFLSFLISIFFVTYPAHTEAVSYISGRGNVLAALFMLLCFIFYIKQLSSKKISFYILMILSYIAALLSKENALILPVLFVLYHYSFHKKIDFKLLLTFVLIIFIYLAMRTAALGSFYQGAGILIKRIPGFFVAITNYLRILILPFNLRIEYGNDFFSPFEPKALFGLAATLLLISYALRKDSQKRIILFPVAWFFVALLPTSSVYPIAAFYMTEHWLYFPSIGFFFIVAYWLIFLYKSQKLRRLSVCMMACAVLAYAVLTIKQNNYWREPLSFYERTLRFLPSTSRVYNNLGVEYLKRKEMQKAVIQFQKAIALNPRMCMAYCNLGRAYLETGNRQKALEAFFKAIEINPRYVAVYNEICNVCIEMGKNEEAIPFCKKAIELDSSIPTFYYNLGNAYDNLGKREDAIIQFSMAVRLDPDFIEAANNLASLYAERGEVDKAIDEWNKIVRLDPDFAIAHFNLAVFYFQKKNYDLAIKHCDRVVELGSAVDPKFLKMLEEYRR